MSQFISSISELNEVKNKFSVGDTVNLTIYRNGKKISVDVVLGESTAESVTQEQQNEEQQQQNYNNYYDYYGGDNDLREYFGGYGLGF